MSGTGGHVSGRIVRNEGICTALSDARTGSYISAIEGQYDGVCIYCRAIISQDDLHVGVRADCAAQRPEGFDERIRRQLRDDAEVINPVAIIRITRPTSKAKTPTGDRTEARDRQAGEDRVTVVNNIQSPVWIELDHDINITGAGAQ